MGLQTGVAGQGLEPPILYTCLKEKEAHIYDNPINVPPPSYESVNGEKRY